ncbi:MAG: dihydrodipicolinate synthase family protein [Caldilineaceae bacterium]
MINRFSGAWPALITPHTADGGVNVDVLTALTEHLLAQGADGLYVCGSTGEGVYMPVAQRKLVVETVTAHVQGRVPVIAHIGALAMADALELARHAQEASVQGISSIIPPFYRSGPAAKAYFGAIGDAVPDLPLLPYLIGLPMDLVSLMKLLMEIPSVAGTKYTGPDMYEFREILHLSDGQRRHGWTIFSGMDEQCALAAMFGSHGNIGSTLNFMPGIYKQIHAAVQAGDLTRARDLQLRANEATRIAISFGFMSALFDIMNMLGFDCGDPLLPNVPLSGEQKGELRRQLAEVGFEEIVSMA